MPHAIRYLRENLDKVCAISGGFFVKVWELKGLLLDFVRKAAKDG